VGRVALKSQLNELEQPKSGRDVPQPELGADSGQVNVLVVADVPKQSSEIETILAGLGLNVVVAPTGRDALDRLLKEEYAVILLTAQMKEMDGFETADRIRRRKRTEHTPILFLAGDDGAVETARNNALPFVDFVTAPVDPVLLRTKVGVYVDLYQKTELMREQAAHRVQLAREQAARQVAENAMRRSALLAEASRVLSRSLDFNDTLIGLHRALVPALADACQLILSDQNGELWYSSIDDQPAANTSSSGSHGRIQKVNEELAAVVRESIETGQTNLVPGEAVANAPNLSRDQVCASAVVAPLIARDTPIGAIVCCRQSTRRRFGQPDIALIEDLAGRAATALDNAQLFQTIRDGERRKDEFLAMLGHELRNPLAAITNAGELTRLLSPSDPNFQETLEIIRQQATLMKRLVDDLLDVSRITSGRIQLQRTTLCAGEVVARVAEANSAAFTSRSQVLHLSVPDEAIYLEADPCRLEQILSNLLVNASKYTDPGGQIWFGVSRDDDDALFRVKDSGIGIGPDLLPHVFDLFSQANRSLHRSEGGLGIGLTIVKGLTDLHGGRVWAASDGIGRGSQFCVWLPAHRAPLRAERPNRSAEKASILPAQTRRVLVVEDQPALLHVTVALLRRLGHEVHAAANGEEALWAVKEYRPEVVFLDIGLPGMNGYDVARSMRQEFGDQAPILVAMTGYGQHEVDRHSGRAKFDCHLVKPVDINAMQQLFCQMGASR
jgi:signal transduction histidine kinase/DNA-binding response OmpR family regulator